MKTLVTAIIASTSLITASGAKPNNIEQSLRLEAAVQLEEVSRRGDLNENLLTAASELLDDQDLFVRAMGEWAIARKIGRDNNHEEIKSVESSDAEWYKKWSAISVNDRIEMDWCRQAISNAIYNNPEKLRSSVDKIITRVNAMGPDAATAAKLKSLRSKMDATKDASILRRLWVDARRANRSFAFAKANLDFDQLILYNRFACHYKPNVCGVNTSWSYKPGGDIVVVSGLEKHAKATPLIKGKLGPGHIHGMDLSFDKSKVVFAWASQEQWPPKFSTHWPRGGNECFAFELRNTTTPTHLYEMDIASGEITQLTDHNFWTDLEPLYCPDGTIAFTSDRSGHSPSCDSKNNDLTDTNIYSLSADRKSIRRLTNQKDVDMHPHLLDNGLIAYLRWEYQERHFWDVHSIWTVKPDGTMSDALFKQHLGSPMSVRDARSVPNTGKLVAIAAGHHTLAKGPIVILNPTQGTNESKAITKLTIGPKPQEDEVNKWSQSWKWPKQRVKDGGVRVAGGFFMMPYAISEKVFLASYGYGNKEARRYGNHHADVDSNGLGVYLLDSYGNMELIYRNPLYSSYSVLPFKNRKSISPLPDMVDNTKNYATCVIPDVYEGMPDVTRGTIKYIRISEALPWPIVPGEGVKRWTHGWSLSYNKRWNPVRVIGTVPVEKDGSAHFKVPVADNASVYFQVLDKKHMEIRRMRSSVSFQPGERRSCNGCHETNTTAPSSKHGIAIMREPDMPSPPKWGINKQLALDWMVQPILDKNCVSCHGENNPKKNINLTKEKSYQTIIENDLVSLSPMDGDGSITQSYQFGSHKSKLITQLLKPNTPCKANLDQDEWLRLVTWVDANAPENDNMFHVRTADGKEHVWRPYPWKDPWTQPKHTPAKGEYLKIPNNKWLEKLGKKSD